MTAFDKNAWGFVAACLLAWPSNALGQIVINEIVKEERTAGSGTIANDSREFIELYNAGAAPVDLSNWSLAIHDIAAGSPLASYNIPSGTIQPGGYFVIGDSGVPNVNFTPPTAPAELFGDVVANLVELRNGPNGTGSLVDAIAYDVWQAGATGLTLLTSDQLNQIGNGFQGQLMSMNATSPNIPASWGRYRDGVDTNRNGHDFGILPVTPGATNNLPINAKHTIPDVNATASLTELSAQYYASFILPTVIDPLVADASFRNPRALPSASPQGGNAIVAWDHTGGGNVAHSRELVNSFELYAYFDTTPLGIAAITGDSEWETSAYGIGSADPFYANPNPTNIITGAGMPAPPAPTANASTGIGWVYQQWEPDPDVGGDSFSKLMLIDFGDGGNSRPDAGNWTVIQDIDMSVVASGWYKLGITYDPNTGNVIATFDNQQFNFTTAEDLAGTFFVGYREGITGAVSVHRALHNPPTYDLIAAAGVPGDYNNNNVVDAADYVVWRNAAATDTLPNDPTPGTVDNSDYLLWRANFGKALAGSGGVSNLALVPEPTSVGLLLSSLLFAAAVRRRA